AVFVPGNRGRASAVTCPADVVHFVREAFQHGKPIAAIGSGVELLRLAALPVHLAETGTEVVVDRGVVTSVDGVYDDFVAALVAAIEAGRDWSRAPGSLPV
ncbi:MAG TPA: catalase HPII, partial [Mycobacteriales bacterium]|nr:catalase HPII [Mycobacteriales bacterium]